MVYWRTDSETKQTGSGGKRTSLRYRDKLLSEKGGLFTQTKADPKKETVIHTEKGQGNTIKTRAKSVQKVNVRDPATNTYRLMEVVTVRETPDNTDYARRNIITKGAVVEVKDGDKTVKCRITSRPGQEGSVSGVLA